jgi:hypothetical protein
MAGIYMCVQYIIQKSAGDSNVFGHPSVDGTALGKCLLACLRVLERLTDQRVWLDWSKECAQQKTGKPGCWWRQASR